MLRTFALLLPLASLAAAAPQEPTPPALPTFTAESELVVLHVAVRDGRGAYVADLPQEAFSVSENRQPQNIVFFNRQDAPVTVGLLIDSSGSMTPHRNMVIAASMAFAKSMNPQDEFFVLGFNDFMHTPLPEDRPFTHHEPTLRVALVQAIKAEGKTAIYDAIDAGLAYVKKGSFERQVLVVVSDGGDNASERTKREALVAAQASNALIYTIGLIDPMERDADPGFLRQLAESSGGVAFRPRRVDELSEVFGRIARDIRNMYTIGYVPGVDGGHGSAAAAGEALRTVSVEVRSSDGDKLNVRTRRAYMDAHHGATP